MHVWGNYLEFYTVKMCTHVATVCVHTRLCTRAWERAGHMRLVHQQGSLAPRPTRSFCSSVCVANNTWMRKSGEERGRPGIIHHVSDIRWTRGGRKGGGAHSRFSRPETVHHPVGLVRMLRG